MQLGPSARQGSSASLLHLAHDIASAHGRPLHRSVHRRGSRLRRCPVALAAAACARALEIPRALGLLRRRKEQGWVHCASQRRVNPTPRRSQGVGKRANAQPRSRAPTFVFRSARPSKGTHVLVRHTDAETLALGIGLRAPPVS